MTEPKAEGHTDLSEHTYTNLPNIRSGIKSTAEPWPPALNEYVKKWSKINITCSHTSCSVQVFEQITIKIILLTEYEFSILHEQDIGCYIWKIKKIYFTVHLGNRQHKHSRAFITTKKLSINKHLTLFIYLGLPLKCEGQSKELIVPFITPVVWRCQYLNPRLPAPEADTLPLSCLGGQYLIKSWLLQH